MIDKDIIEALPEEESKIVKMAILTIYNSGVVHAQQDRVISQMTSGPENESDESLMERIRKFRVNSARLQALLELGQSIKEERIDAS